MKKILLTLALSCLAVCSYAQRDIPAGACMEVASVETNDTFGDHVGLGKQITLYKIKDKEGNPSFLLSVSHTMASLIFGTEDSNTSFTFPAGAVLLDMGTTYQEAMDNLDSLLATFADKDGAQKELVCQDGTIVLCTLHKGMLGKHLSIEETSVSKSDLKSLKTSFKISKKLHKDL